MSVWFIEIPSIGRLTSLKFEFPTEDVHQQLYYRVHGCEGVRKEDESDDDGELFVKAKGLVEGAVVDEDGEEGEDIECVKLVKVRIWCTVHWANHLPARSQVILSCAQDSNVQAHVPTPQQLLPSRSSRLGYHR